VGKLTQALQAALVEKDVENAYREAIHAARPQATLTSPHGTDGYAQWAKDATTVRLLLEAKYDLDFKARIPVCSTLGQCILYLKKFEAPAWGVRARVPAEVGRVSFPPG